MNYIDIIVAPFYFLIAFFIAYLYKTKNKRNEIISQYFLSAYVIRILGGLAFGCIYFFYYHGGDTFNYFNDSKVISEALRTDFFNGIKLIFDLNFKDGNLYNYIQRMNFAFDPPSLYISRSAGIINIFTFDSYISTTIVFSLLSFWGSWKLFLTLGKMFPYLYKELSIGCLYLPSIVFWTGGIMKDTLCCAALCLLFCSIINIIYFKKYSTGDFLMILFCTYILTVVKIYIIMSFASTISIYVLSLYNNKIKNKAFRAFLRPLFFSIALILSYFATILISSEDKKYNLENISTTAISTANYLSQTSLEVGGSYYSLGNSDLTLTNIPILTIKAFIVTFYRPFIWEVYNPLMFLSMLEGLYFLYITYLFLRYIINTKRGEKIFTPFTTFCFLFSIAFAFGVGVVSNNFGTLARYKTPMLPFFVCGIYATIKSKDNTNNSNQLL
jgi:hypothetical protein